MNFTSVFSVCMLSNSVSFTSDLTIRTASVFGPCTPATGKTHTPTYLNCYNILTVAVTAVMHPTR